jgi:hypothetical protein
MLSAFRGLQQCVTLSIRQTACNNSTTSSNRLRLNVIFRFRFPGRGSDFLSSPPRPDRIRGPPSPLSKGYRELFPREVKNTWSYTSTPIRLHTFYTLFYFTSLKHISTYFDFLPKGTSWKTTLHEGFILWYISTQREWVEPHSRPKSKPSIFWKIISPKVKSSLGSERHTTKVYWGVEVKLHPFFYLDTRWRWVDGFTPQPFYSQGTAPCTHWIGGWVGPRAGLDAVVKRKIPARIRTPDHLALSLAPYHRAIPTPHNHPKVQSFL